MNKDVIRSVGIDPEQSLKGLLEDLESKQFEFLERLETVSDPSRKAELTNTLSLIENEISEVKNQIKAVRSAIILDDTADSEDKKTPAAEEKTASGKAGSDDIAKKVEAIKEKAAEQKRKQEEKEQEAQKTATIKLTTSPIDPNMLLTPDSSTGNNTANNTGSTGSPAGNKAGAATGSTTGNTMGTANAGATGSTASGNAAKDSVAAKTAAKVSPELAKAMVDRKNGNYAAAFTVIKSLAEQRDSLAQYLLAIMYQQGEGTKQDMERTLYWLKESADLGETYAQHDYAVFLLKGKQKNDKETAEGLRYLAQAADKGDAGAMQLYIDTAMIGIGGKKAAGLAIQYCDQLSSLSSDSFDIKKLADTKEALIAAKKKAKKTETQYKNVTRFAIIGTILALIGAMYMFGGIHADVWETNPLFKYLPSAGEKLVLPFLWGWSGMAAVMNVNGLFGLQIFTIGCMFKAASKNFLKETLVKVIQVIGNIILSVLGLWCLVLAMMDYQGVFKYFGEVLICVVLAMLVGKLLGVILGKIAKTRYY